MRWRQPDWPPSPRVADVHVIVADDRAAVKRQQTRSSGAGTQNVFSGKFLGPTPAARRAWRVSRVLRLSQFASGSRPIPVETWQTEVHSARHDQTFSCVPNRDVGIDRRISLMTRSLVGAREQIEIGTDNIRQVIERRITTTGQIQIPPAPDQTLI